MQIVATLGSFRLKPEVNEVKLTMKHSSPGSDTESDVIDMETHSEESDIENVPV